MNVNLGARCKECNEKNHATTRLSNCNKKRSNEYMNTEPGLQHKPKISLKNRLTISYLKTIKTFSFKTLLSNGP